jgi:hypothetical protein
MTDVFGGAASDDRIRAPARDRPRAGDPPGRQTKDCWLMRVRGSWRLGVMATCLVASALGTGQAQTVPQGPVVNIPTVNRLVNLNYVYAADLGFGGYSLSGLTANVYTLPLSFTIHDVRQGDGWGMQVLAPVQFGVYNFRATGVDGRYIAIDQYSVAEVPGVEFQIPVGERTMVKPFGQFGIANAFGPNVGNPNSWVYLGGVRAVTQWHAGDYTLSLGEHVIYAGDATVGPGFAERFVSLSVGGEIRHPLGFTIGRATPDIGVYLAQYYYPSPLQFSRFSRPDLKVVNQGEVGLSIGSTTPYHMLFLDSPRIGIGYVFGGGLDVWHVNFGFPF